MSKKPEFIGLETVYPTADGKSLTRLHMDGAASPLAAKIAVQTVEQFLPHYSNSHSYVHHSAQISTKALEWSHNTILKVLGADPTEYTSIFNGSGATACINRVARGLATARPNRKVVLVSAMEHHANDLPHRQFGNEVIYIPLNGESVNQGSVDLDQFELLCEKHAANLNYVAVSAISNVTGIRNPISAMTKIAHKYGGLILIDAAQSVAHCASEIDNIGADFFVFSGHKVYTPMSPGVLIAKKATLMRMSGQDLGGGSVSDVSYFDFEFHDNYPDKEQSGTPNILGAIALGRVLESLNRFGYKEIEKHDRHLMGLLIDGLSKFEKITIYGDPNCLRTGALAFNHSDIRHGLLAAILNDYFAIAVRNECFCAHPYVSALLKEQLWEIDLDGTPEGQHEMLINQHRGMVRVSLSLYNEATDIRRLLDAVNHIEKNLTEYEAQYQALADGSFKHLKFAIDWRTITGFTEL